MGYSKNPRSFQRVKEYLTELLELKQGDVREWSTDDNETFSYWLREGLAYAKEHREEVGDRYADLMDKVRISKIKNKISVSLKFHLTVKSIGAHSKSYPEVTTLSEIITNVIRDKEVNEWRFPSLQMDSIDLTKLNKWAQAENKTVSQIGDTLTIKNEQTSNSEEHRN